MKGPGILWMLQTAAGFSMAGPLLYLGLASVRMGRYGWAAFYLALGAIVLYFPTYIVNRIGGPRAWIRRRIGRSGAAESDAEADEPVDSGRESVDAADGTEVGETGDTGDTGAETKPTDSSASPLDRLLRR